MFGITYRVQASSSSLGISDVMNLPEVPTMFRGLDKFVCLTYGECRGLPSVDSGTNHGNVTHLGGGFPEFGIDAVHGCHVDGV